MCSKNFFSKPSLHEDFEEGWNRNKSCLKVILARSARPFRQLLLFLIFHYIFYVTFQNLAENFYRMGTNTFITLQSRYLSRADMIFVNQSILCYSFFFHCLP